MMFSELRARVETEIDEYVIAEQQEAVGATLPSSWFTERLASMKDALVAPYATRLRDLDQDSRAVVVSDVVIVADDGEGSLIAYDPSQDNFVLAVNELDADRARAVDSVSCGVRGSAIDCFLSA